MEQATTVTDRIVTLARDIADLRRMLDSLEAEKARLDAKAAAVRREIGAKSRQLLAETKPKKDNGAVRGRRRRSGLRESLVEYLLREDAVQVAELSSALGASRPAIYAHLAALRKAGDVERLEDHHWGLTDAAISRLRARSAPAQPEDATA